MTDDIVICAEGLGKKYIIGHETERERYVALRDVVMRTGRNAWRKTSDLFSGRDIVAGDEVEEFWALKDVSFEVKRGEVLGIIGRNGAGKSTLLKVLSRITEPSEGRVTIKGRVASLLEVGTGFHPELTGRENIYLNGAILGMTRAEIKRKFDEIVAFSEVEKFLDTPVKRYSSGMYVRLAFAVAAHLEPEVLIVDEVLSVGDAEFQKKCLGKMQEVAGFGRTVLFVSHNMTLVQALCSKGVLLQSGCITLIGNAGEVTRVYSESGERNCALIRPMRENGLPTVTALEVNSVEAREQTRIRLRFDVSSHVRMKCGFEVKIYDNLRTAVGIASVGLVDPATFVEFVKGREEFNCELVLPRLARGIYWIIVQLTVPLVKIVDTSGDGVVFEVHPEPMNGHERAIEQSWGCGALEISMQFARNGTAFPNE